MSIRETTTVSLKFCSHWKKKIPKTWYFFFGMYTFWWKIVPESMVPVKTKLTPANNQVKQNCASVLLWKEHNHSFSFDKHCRNGDEKIVTTTTSVCFRKKITSGSMQIFPRVARKSFAAVQLVDHLTATWVLFSFLVFHEKNARNQAFWNK